MSRAVAIAVLLLTARAQAEPLFPPLADKDTPRAQLARSLDSLGHAQLAARARAVAAISTREALEQRRAQVKATLLRLIGPLPTRRTPLAARVTGHLERPDFRVEKVIYQSQPGFPVTASLYLPRGRGPFPGVIAPVGHYDTGKTGEWRGADLARKGFVVLVPDPLGQGERLQHYDPELRTSRTGGATEEHGQAAGRAALVGGNVARYFIWDAMRGLDYLAARPEVDATRLGAVGCSGGGTQTTYLTALDERVKVAVVACYLTDWAHLLDGPGPQEAEQSFPGFLAEGLDLGDWVSLIAPRPLLVAATAEDFFPLAGARAIYEEGRRLYGLLGAADRIALFVGPGEHGTPRESREAISAFLLERLGRGGDAKEPPDAMLDPEDLDSTASGQLATTPGPGGKPWKTVADLVAAEPRAARPAPGKDPAAFRRQLAAAVTAITGVSKSPPLAPLVVVRSVARAGYRLEVVSWSADGVTMWGLLAVPAGEGRKPAVLLLDPTLRGRLGEPGGEIDRLARAGRVVFAVEPRGAALEPESSSARVSLLGSAAQLERRAEVVGKTLAGLRTEDLLGAIQRLTARADVDGARLSAFAQGTYAVPLLHAAVLDERIGRLVLRDSPVTYRAILAHSIHRNLPEIALPGVLQRYDLDDLMVALAPRPLILVNPLDPVGQPFRRVERDRVLGPARAAAARFGQPFQVVKKGGPALLLAP